MFSSGDNERNVLNKWRDTSTKLRGTFATADGGLSFVGSVAAFTPEMLQLVGPEWDLLLNLDGSTISIEDAKSDGSLVREEFRATFSRSISVLLPSRNRLILAEFRPVN